MPGPQSSSRTRISSPMPPARKIWSNSARAAGGISVVVLAPALVVLPLVLALAARAAGQHQHRSRRQAERGEEAAAVHVSHARTLRDPVSRPTP